MQIIYWTLIKREYSTDLVTFETAFDVLRTSLLRNTSTLQTAEN